MEVFINENPDATWKESAHDLTHWGPVTPYEVEILANTGSGNGLLPDGTKPLPAPMLTDHQQGPGSDTNQ